MILGVHEGDPICSICLQPCYDRVCRDCANPEVNIRGDTEAHNRSTATASDNTDSRKGGS